jgi:lysozyme family protein
MPYSAPFQRAIAFILPHEEDFARGHWGDENFVVTEDVPGDDGGATKYGIDAAGHPGIDVPHLTRDGAIAIYWKEWSLRNMDALPAKLAICAFDVWVNGGSASLWLQHAYNATRGAGAPALAEDGQLGPMSIRALQLADPDAITKVFLQERDARFQRLAANAHDRQFLAGWEQRDKDLTAFLAA